MKVYALPLKSMNYFRWFIDTSVVYAHVVLIKLIGYTILLSAVTFQFDLVSHY